jgi:hypothetical protein
MFYFHFENGSASFDSDGLELPDMPAVRAEAVATVADILRDSKLDSLWRGMPLRLWVTDKPNGQGKVLFVLNINATSTDVALPRPATSPV